MPMHAAAIATRVKKRQDGAGQLHGQLELAGDVLVAGGEQAGQGLGEDDAGGRDDPGGDREGR